MESGESDKSEWNRNQCQNWKPNYRDFSLESASKIIFVVVSVECGFRSVLVEVLIRPTHPLSRSTLVQVHNIYQAISFTFSFAWNYGIVWWWQINHGKIWRITRECERMWMRHEEERVCLCVARWIEKKRINFSQDSMLLCLSWAPSFFSFHLLQSLRYSSPSAWSLRINVLSIFFFFFFFWWCGFFFALLSPVHIWQSFGEEHIWATKWQHWMWLAVGTEQTDMAMEVNVFRIVVLCVACSISSSILLLYNWIESTCVLLWAMDSFSERSPISSHTHTHTQASLIYMHSSTFTRSHMEYNEWIWIFLPHHN